MFHARVVYLDEGIQDLQPASKAVNTEIMYAPSKPETKSLLYILRCPFKAGPQRFPSILKDKTPNFPRLLKVPKATRNDLPLEVLQGLIDNELTHASFDRVWFIRNLANDALRTRAR